MAEERIEEIYSYAKVISELRVSVERFRYQEDNIGASIFRKLIPEIERFLKACVEDQYNEYPVLCEKLYSIKEIEDMIFVADMLEEDIIPIMERWIQSWVAIEEQMDDRYIIESTATGFLTIKDIHSDRYLHSNNDPMNEARKAVENQFEYGKTKYVVWGCGLGYHIYQLYRISEGTIPIIVYESNPNLIKYALLYGVLSWIPKEIIQIKAGYNGKEFVQSISEEDGVFMLYPYLDAMQNIEQRNLLMEQYLQNSADWEVKKELEFNLCRNSELNLPDIHEIDQNRMKSEVVVVGAGPSVDDSIDLLRIWKKDKTIVAVGSIWKKLLSEGIIPDYAVVMDPYSGIGSQVEGINEFSTILIVNMLAYWKVARTYKGSVFTVCIEGPQCGIVEYAQKKGLELWNSGGNVGALALDFSIRFGAKKIYFTGIDLAVKDGADHAEGTEYREVLDTSKMISVEGNEIERVYTNATFLLYKEWIEKRIAMTCDIEYINMSHIGAKIEGAHPLRNDR